MITAQIDPTPAIAKLDETKQRLRANVRGAVEDGAAQLYSRVQGKLSGEVLNAGSGALSRSIRSEIAEDTDGIVARIFSDGSVPYARIQEYGGRINIPAIGPVQAKVLAFADGGRKVFAHKTVAHIVDIPERSYMRSALDEFAAAFADDVRNTVMDAL
jgi:phage gpG-like protein